MPRAAGLYTFLVVLAAAGCGGGGGDVVADKAADASATYDVNQSAECLRRDRLTPDADIVDAVAHEAPGSFVVILEGSRVNVSIGGEVDTRVEAYRAGGREPEVYGDAVLAWEGEPTDADRERVVGCLIRL
jgi:hypothetical protein